MTKTDCGTKAMTPMQRKTFENRLRRMAARQGLRLEKSRRRDPLAYDFGAYYLIEGPPPDAANRNWRSRALVSPESGMSLSEVHDFLTGADR